MAILLRLLVITLSVIGGGVGAVCLQYSRTPLWGIGGLLLSIIVFGVIPTVFIERHIDFGKNSGDA